MPYAAADVGRASEIWNTGIVIVVALLMRKIVVARCASKRVVGLHVKRCLQTGSCLRILRSSVCWVE